MDIKKFNRANSKDFIIRQNRLNIGISTEKIDTQKEIQTERLMNQIKIKLPTISQKKLFDDMKTMTEEKNLGNDFTNGYMKNINLNTIINSYSEKPKVKIFNNSPLNYYTYNRGSKKNNKINSCKKYQTLNKENKNMQKIFFIKNNNLDEEKLFKIITIKNSPIRKTKKLKTVGYNSCEKKIVKLLKEKSSSKNNMINSPHENKKVLPNKNDNISTMSIIFDNDEFKERKYYKSIQKMEKEVLDNYKNKFANIRQVNVNFLLNGEKDKINENVDIKNRIIKSYKEFKKNQDNERKIREQNKIKSKKKKIFSIDNEKNKNNFNKFYKYNRNKKSIKHLKMILENIDSNMHKRLENFSKTLDDEFKKFSSYAYKPLKEVFKIKNK